MQRLSIIAAGLMTCLISPLSSADGGDYGYYRDYKITITNITKGQTFTPVLAATHKASVSLFKLGDPASEALEILAEGGNTGPATEALEALGDRVGSVITDADPALLGPGESKTFDISSTRRHTRLTLAAMLIPTNDTFVAANSVRLPRHGSVVYLVPAYDAGTEVNDQNCANIPGPRCGGVGDVVDEDGEGFVYISNGFHELGDAMNGETLGPLDYDWRNPVARIEVRLKD